MFDTDGPMASLSPDVSAALASLQTRWGAAAPRVVGALATAPRAGPFGSEACTGRPAKMPAPTNTADQKKCFIAAKK